VLVDRVHDRAHVIRVSACVHRDNPSTYVKQGTGAKADGKLMTGRCQYFTSSDGGAATFTVEMPPLPSEAVVRVRWLSARMSHR
jgi:hypothetical protein